jgi:transposase
MASISLTKEFTWMSLSPEPDFAAFIAIDWADREHAWSMQVAGSTKRETGKFAHTPEAIEAWAMQWAQRFPGRPVAVALEQSRGALLYALSKFSHLVLYPIHPSTSYGYRKAVFPSGSKDDPKDADLQLDLLTLHRDRLRALEPDTEQTRHLQILVEQRRQLVDIRTAHTNRVTAQLKLYFPQVLDWFDDLAAPICRDFLVRWPTLPVLQAEDPAQLRRFFHQHHSRSEARIETRLHEIPQAKPLTEDPAIIGPGVILVRTLLQAAAALNDGIQELEKSIAELASSHPDFFIFDSFPNAGPAMAPRLLAAFGSRRERFGSAHEVQSFSGIAPVMQASGQKRWIHFRWACPKFLRQTFHEYAGLSMKKCSWAREFYDGQRAKGKGHHAAVRALAFKWIRILFRCWQSRQSYQEELYMAARQSRATPQAHHAPSRLPAKQAPSQRGKRKGNSWKSAGEILKSLIDEA